MADYAALIARMLDGMRSDPAQARQVLYQLLRLTLEVQLSKRGESLPSAQRREEFEALENAIETAEAGERVGDAVRGSRDRRRRDGTGRQASGEPPRWAGNESPPKQPGFGWRGRPAHSRSSHFELVRWRESLRQIGVRLADTPGWARRAAELTVAAVLPVVIYAAVTSHSPGKTSQTAAPTVASGAAVPPAPDAAPPAETPARPPFPLPALYGVYAVVDQQLVPLPQAATAPFDPRVKTVLQLTAPPRVSLPRQNISLLVFRRDIVASAPEKLPIRIAAKLRSMMMYDENGKAVTMPPAEERWIIRNIGFDFGVRPLRENNEMIIAQPEDPGFSLPPGRYVVQVNGSSYDFAIEGAVSDADQCMESVATARGPVLYECRQPK